MLIQRTLSACEQKGAEMRLSEYCNLKRNDWVAYDDVTCQVARIDREHETLQLKHNGKRLGWHSYMSVGLAQAPIESDCVRCKHLGCIKYDAKRNLVPLSCKLLNNMRSNCHDYQAVSWAEFLKRKAKYVAYRAYFKLYGKVTKIMQK